MVTEPFLLPNVLMEQYVGMYGNELRLYIRFELKEEVHEEYLRDPMGSRHSLDRG
jgi:hypothetical protein